MSDALILVVDDNHYNLKFTRVLLESEGFAVRCASSGEAALGVLATLTPDLILMDVQLPGMDGLEVTRRIRLSGLRRAASEGPVPIVAVTASATGNDRARAVEAGCDAWLSKPIDVPHLLSTVRTLLESRSGPPISQETGS